MKARVPSALILSLAFFLFSICGSQAEATPLLNLSQFRKEAIKNIEDEYGIGAIVEEKGIWYEDGASGIIGPGYGANDQGRVYFVAGLKQDLLPSSQLDLAWSIGLNGSKGRFSWVTSPPDRMRGFLSAYGGTATLEQGLSKDSIQSFFARIRSRFSSVVIKHYEYVGAIGFQCAPKDLASVFHFIASAPEIHHADLSGEILLIDIDFERPILLDSGKVNATLDLAPYRKVARRLAANGICLFTRPSLPPPFGGGVLRNPSCSSEPKP